MAAKQKTKAAISQSQKFVEAARATGCDEDEAAFDDRLRKIAKATAKEPARMVPPRAKAKRSKEGR
jgi:hypothetical protein